MGRAKDIIVKVIPSKIANRFVKKNHYSGKIVNNSSLHFGCFLDGKLHGVMSYGSPLDKRKVLPLVHTKEDKPVLWNEMLELNRMAFDDVLPRNSESRCIAISFKLIKKNAPHIKWILSFSDAVLCGDGAIYRASGFFATKINSNTENWILPNEQVVQGCTLRQSGYTTWLKPFISKSEFDKIRNGSTSSKRVLDYIGAKKLNGFQIRYIKLLYKDLKLNCTNIPFSKIDELGAGMYKGKKITLAERQNKN